MRPSPASCRTPDEIDRSDAPRSACHESCASPVQPAPPPRPRSTDVPAALQIVRRSVAHAVSPFLWLEVRTGASAGVSGTTTARSIPGNRWCRIHGHRQPCLLYTSDAAEEEDSVDLG